MFKNENFYNNRMIIRFPNDKINLDDINNFKLENGSPNLYKLHHTFGMMCYLITPKGCQKLLNIPQIHSLGWFPLYIEGLNRTIHTYTLDCLLNKYYDEINAFITIPFMAITQNDKTQSDCTTG